MAIKKSELYSSLWSSCDELRGGMDASQYKDYVLVMLFIKYVSDKYADVPYAPITIPKGSSFTDMVALKGKPDIGDQINKKIIAPLAQANKLSDMPDFNDPGKLGSGPEQVEKLTNLIAIFENKALDFSKHRAEDDDLLGDAYEYLMRHFATESGKSKGQFYTPAEVSRVMAQIIGIREAHTTNDTTVYDPTCGSGSLLLKVGTEAHARVTLYGQEKDSSTAGLARMNMILHDYATAEIKQGNTLANPLFKDGDALKTFDYVVANPPFSDKRWSTGIDPLNDPHQRFQHYGTPPAKQGDYAYLLHIVRSLKSTGKGACILPHGVLFRGNAEADIRRNLIRKGYIKGIIGLPANLFYGTGIPACLIVIDKQDAHARKGIFMLDASKGFIKDGNKNRLRDCDIHKIVDVFNRRDESNPKYARMIGVVEIEKNEYNLNLPRYIDSSEQEDQQDIAGHLQGGIPQADVDALQEYWTVCPQLRKALFSPRPQAGEGPGERVKERAGYLHLAVPKQTIKPAIYQHAEFTHFIERMNELFAEWREQTSAALKITQPNGFHPKDLIAQMSDSLLGWYAGKPLIDQYDVYQHLMDYWAATMQDDCYLIADDGWKAPTYRILEVKKNKDGKVTKQADKGWACDLVPKQLIVNRYFAAQQAAIRAEEVALENVVAQLSELEEEHGGEDGAFAELDKVNKANVAARLKEMRAEQKASTSSFPRRRESSAVKKLDARLHGHDETDTANVEAAALNTWLKLNEQESELKKSLRDAEAELDALAYAKYPKLSEAEIKTLVVDDKWLAVLDKDIHGEMDRISQALTRRVKELAERYETPLPVLENNVATLSAKVAAHLRKMGFQP
ncbi:MAG TPA: type I restriction-modification system subunit M [Gallionella sp.]|nr:type I restriction-modification system subunit M [Gallionella sp.]